MDHFLSLARNTWLPLIYAMRKALQHELATIGYTALAVDGAIGVAGLLLAIIFWLTFIRTVGDVGFKLVLLCVWLYAALLTSTVTLVWMLNERASAAPELFAQIAFVVRAAASGAQAAWTQVHNNATAYQPE